ncbi:MAG: MurR/RpiR family transcriptional regulator [Mycoplasmataceae bacterium]|nr:MurR/RpiR family transcriptional regulator [Mycoplasmataceae bacterium]
MKILKKQLIISNLTKTDQKIIDYVEKNPKQFTTQSIKSNAVKIGVSSSTLSKFISKNYESNYKEFGFMILESLLSNENKTPNKIESPYIDNFTKNSILVVTETSNKINYLNIKRAKEFLEKADSICTFGEGMSKIASISLGDDLTFIGMNVYTAYTLLDIATWVDKENNKSLCVVIFSKLMNKKNTIKIIEQLSKNKISVIIISANNNVNLLPNTMLINYETILRLDKWGDYSSKTSQMFICGLIVNLFVEYNENNRTTFLNEFVNDKIK